MSKVFILKSSMARQKKSKQTYDVIEVRDVKPGMIVRLHQKIKDVNAKGEEKERIQVYEGLVIKKRGGTEPGATMTIRKVTDGVGVEKIYPLTLPAIAKIELVKTYKVRRANLSFLRNNNKRLKEVKATA